MVYALLQFPHEHLKMGDERLEVVLVKVRLLLPLLLSNSTTSMSLSGSMPRLCYQDL